MTDEQSFEQIRQRQVASLRPEIHCVISLVYVDVHSECRIIACFFDKEDALKAMAWMEQEKPIASAVGWYEIETTNLSTIKE